MPGIRETADCDTQTYPQSPQPGDISLDLVKHKPQPSPFLNNPQVELVWQVRNRVDYHPPSLYQPYDVKCHEGCAILAEGLWPFSRLQVFDPLGHSVAALGQGQILPFGLTLTSESHIAVTDHKDRTVKIMDCQGNKISSWAPGLFDWPNGITTNNADQFVITDWTRGTINIHDKDGKSMLSFKTAGVGSSDFSCPEYVCVDQYDRIIFSDTYDHTIKIFDESGRFLQKFGDESCPQGCIEDPRGVCLDRQGNILVADWAANKVKLYSGNGRWIKDILTQDHGVQHPWGIDMDGDGNLLMTEHKISGTPSLKKYSWK